MNDRAVHTLFALALSLVAFTAVQLGAAPAHADSGGRVVLLDIPGGGTDVVTEKLEENDQIDIKPQSWFLSKIQELDLKAKGIMKRPEDVRKLMRGANIDYIMYMEPAEQEGYKARVVDKSGEVTHDFKIDRATDGLSKVHAVQVSKKFDEFLERESEGESSDSPRVAPLDDGGGDSDSSSKRADRESEADPNITRAQASQSDEDIKEALSEDWLTLRAHGGMLRRDLSFSGTNDAVLSYASAPYFGFGIDAEAFPLASYDVDYADVGFYIDYIQGFDAANVGEDGAPRSIMHSEFEGGLLYQLGERVESIRSDDASMQMGVGVRHNHYGIDDNPSLPSLSHTAVVISSSAKRQAFTEGLELRVGADFVPLGIYGENGALFGESSRGYGFGSEIDATYFASDDIAMTLGYEFRFHHTIFEGQGERDFEQATGFELVQGLTGGLLYRY